ncbi:hypothetical protein BGP_6319 [Beggiatoa sp. PS]|nr:hypothetical protein BGP_6319 [Beggiatoa sp. PS]
MGREQFQRLIVNPRRRLGGFLNQYRLQIKPFWRSIRKGGGQRLLRM